MKPRAGEPHATAFGRLLRFWRKSFGRSQEELALDLDASPRHISRLENGRVLPSVEMVQRIAATLGLGRRDTIHLLSAAGHTPPPETVDFQAPDLRWLRKSTALMVSALDPYPSLLTDSVSRILLVNRSWLGLLGQRVDPGGPEGLRQYFDFLLESIGRGDGSGARRDLQCGLLMTLQQEALIRDDPRQQALVDRLAQARGLPPDWPVRASRTEPTASFALPIEIDGRPERFYHVSRSISPAGPSSYMTGAGLAILSLLPDDFGRDWSFLAERAGDHPALASHELVRGAGRGSA